LPVDNAHAVGLPTWRGVAMSNSVSGASSVSYTVSFVPATATSLEGIVIDFCTDSPIVSSTTCTQPSSMTVGGAITSLSGLASTPATITANNTSRNDLSLSNGSAIALSAATTTSSNITSTGQSTFTVTSSASYPAASSSNPASWFYVNISTETMQVTNVSGSTWTVNRGALGTTALASITQPFAISNPPIQFTITGNTNPNVVGALYARILTFNLNTAATTYAGGAFTGTSYSTAAPNIVDAGGTAEYITSALVITAKVQEFLEFCVYENSGTGAAPCALSGSAVTLGNTQGVLSISSAYVDSSTRFDIETNASGYAAVTYTGAPLKLGATANYIESSANSGTGSVAATAYTSSVGTDQFGLCVSIPASSTYIATGFSSTDTNLLDSNLTYAGGAATLNSWTGDNCPTAWATSNSSSTGGSYGFNIANAGSTFGDLLVTQKPGVGSTGLINIIGNVSATQIAGIYSSTLNFVANSTY
ncbi:MAG TPA: hypothetical protein VMR76_01895, partial [Candidatus Saccharimonadia bacterium]|nr:hypothetical protein [Candidatus Saccharimonadia bacterium]